MHFTASKYEETIARCVAAHRTVPECVAQHQPLQHLDDEHWDGLGRIGKTWQDDLHEVAGLLHGAIDALTPSLRPRTEGPCRGADALIHLMSSFGRRSDSSK